MHNSMFRRDYIRLLLARPRSVEDLARELELRPAEVEQDLRHLMKSLKHHSEYRFVIAAAHCRHCGFTFRRDKLGKPGKCPQCRHTWIEAPLIQIEQNARPSRDD